MVEWLLGSDPAAAECRRHNIFHFVFFSSPDAPSNGWYRVAAQGVDMNRSYAAAGAGGAVAGNRQCHEAALVQRDVEQLMGGQSRARSHGRFVPPFVQLPPDLLSIRCLYF